MSSLELIIGPMFSGKSTELIRRIRLLKNINKKVLVIKPLIDNRYTTDNNITSHNYETCNCISISNLSELSLEYIIHFDTIVIDEGQFFPDLKKFIIYWLNNTKLNIIIGSLDGDYNRNPIGEVLQLIPYANKCHKYSSLCNICNDGTKAAFTKRLVESTEQILVGSKESYIPVCSYHYNIDKYIGNMC
jgi:thymidine kinase